MREGTLPWRSDFAKEAAHDFRSYWVAEDGKRLREGHAKRGFREIGVLTPAPYIEVRCLFDDDSHDANGQL
ncbi:hypothetical protein HYQ46_010818 [Verticillium longisporum]|nr:hypothetical protein HYQ46_010818 [Verticillium longisporum]